VKSVEFPILVATVGTGLFSTLTSIRHATKVHLTRCMRVPPRETVKGGHVMNATILQKEIDVDRAVLDVVKRGEEYNPVDLAGLVVANRGDAALNQDLVLEAIWRLISEGKLELTQQRTLRLKP
jgi:hypothetical protein